MSDKRLAKGLVLAGGASYGSFQAGALKWLIENGHSYDCIAGTSIGSVNAAVLAQYSTGRDEADKFHWNNAGQALEELWMGVTGPQTIYEPPLIRPKIDGVGDLIRLVRYGVSSGPKLLRRLLVAFLVEGRGLLDISPGLRYFNSLLDQDALRDVLLEKAYTEVLLNAVDLKTGQTTIFDRAAIGTNMIDHITASSAIPFVFPTKTINGTEYVDGGVRSNALVAETLRYLTDKQYENGELQKTGKNIAKAGENLTIDVILCFSPNPLESFWQRAETPPGLYTILQSAYCVYEELISGSLDEARAAFPNATIRVIQPSRENGDPIAFTREELLENFDHGYEQAKLVCQGEDSVYENLLTRLERLFSPAEWKKLFS